MAGVELLGPGYKRGNGGVCVLSRSVVSDSQAPQSMAFPRLEYWSGAKTFLGNSPGSKLASAVTGDAAPHHSRASVL